MIELRLRNARRICLAGFVLLAAAVSVGDPLYLWSAAWWNDRPSRDRLPEGMVDDAGRLNMSAAETWRAAGDPADVERELGELLRRARRDNLQVSIAGARHSMGGHTIYPGGLSIDMLPVNGLRLDAFCRIACTRRPSSSGGPIRRPKNSSS